MPSRSTRSRMSSPSILRITTWRAPIPPTANGRPHPLQWNVGSVWRYTSRSVTPMCQPNVTAFSQRLRCVICTPLGRAVVPDV